MRPKGSFWNWYKMMGITKAKQNAARTCTKWLYAHALGLFSNYDPGFPLIIFVTVSNLFQIFLYGLHRIVLLYFQVCSNSAYPQHPDERYRTNGFICHIQNLRDFQAWQDHTGSCFLYHQSLVSDTGPVSSGSIHESKQYRPWSDVAFCSIWPGSVTFVKVPKMWS